MAQGRLSMEANNTKMNMSVRRDLMVLAKLKARRSETYARHSGHLSRKGSLSCHTCCDTGPRFFRSHPKNCTFFFFFWRISINCCITLRKLHWKTVMHWTLWIILLKIYFDPWETLYGYLYNVVLMYDNDLLRYTCQIPQSR
jgi:hypothetical protein